MNWVYPTANQEWERDALFNVDQPIYAETNPYSTKQFSRRWSSRREQWRYINGLFLRYTVTACRRREPGWRIPASRMIFIFSRNSTLLVRSQILVVEYIPVGVVPTTGAAFEGDTATLTFGTFTMEIFSLDLGPGRRSRSTIQAAKCSSLVSTRRRMDEDAQCTCF
jgi:hypothetical protein